MWPLGSLFNTDQHFTSLQQLYSMSFHYGWAEDYRNVRKRLLVFAFAPAGSALNEKIRKHGSHVNRVINEKWDIICPGFSVEGDPLAHTRSNDDLLDRIFEFSEKPYYNFQKDIENIFLKGRDSRYAKSLFYSSAGGFLLANARIGENEVYVDWENSWVLEQRKLDQESIEFDFLADLIHGSQIDRNLETGPSQAAIDRITSEVRFRGQKNIAERIDPASLIMSGASMIIGAG